MSDFFKKGSNDTVVEWTSLRNGLMLTPVLAALGGIAFLIAAIFIIQDRREAYVAMKGKLSFILEESIRKMRIRLAMDGTNQFGLAESIKR